MQVSLFDSFGKSICIACISGYQKYISPHKGFACAHRVLHQGESCSQYVKTVVAREGIRSAIKKSRARFQACKQASQVLQARRLNSYLNSTLETPQRKRKTIKGKCSNCADGMCDVTDACECAEIPCGLVSDCGSADCSGIDCDLHHCSSVDCSGVDCNFFDCGCGG